MVGWTGVVAMSPTSSSPPDASFLAASGQLFSAEIRAAFRSLHSL
jgi:hypothetical protein